MTTYLVSTFSLNMLELPEHEDIAKEYRIVIQLLSLEDFCREVNQGEYTNAIGHQATADLVNVLCNTDLKANRIEVKLSGTKMSELLIVQLTFRPPEGKVYSKEELIQLYQQGKIVFLHVVVIPWR